MSRPQTVLVAGLVAAFVLVGVLIVNRSSGSVSVATRGAGDTLPAEESESTIPPGYEPAVPGWENGPVAPQGLSDKEPEDITPGEMSLVLEGYETTNRIPVSDANSVVGYMEYDAYYANGFDTPDFIEVWSYDDSSLVGYKIQYVGFAPIAEFPETRPVAEVIDELYGDQIDAAVEHQRQVDEAVDAASAEDLDTFPPENPADSSP